MHHLFNKAPSILASVSGTSSKPVVVTAILSSFDRLHTSSRSLQHVDKVEIDRAQVAKFSRFQPSPISIQHFLEFGRSASVETSFTFLRRELPVRLANMMQEVELLPSVIRDTVQCQMLEGHYRQSFNDVIRFEGKNEKDPKILEEFGQTLFRVRDRHADTVTIMAEAVIEVKHQFQSEHLPFEKSIQYFLDRLYMSRIAVRMLINQHILLFGTENKPKHRIGAIDPNCRMVPIVHEAYNNARFLCEQYYMSSPELLVKAVDIHGTDDVECVYVPSHLYHMVFELLKNAMRATVEHAGEDAVHLPPIKVLVVKSEEDITIKISDRGGGIPRRLHKTIFQYLYTTAPNPVVTSSSDSEMQQGIREGTVGVPLAGYGYGLPLSRLYARYFAGDLRVYSCDGYGTDAVIYLQALAKEAKETLPVFHETGSKKIYQAQLTARDWTYSTQEIHQKPKKKK